jgi:hypothetical protein
MLSALVSVLIAAPPPPPTTAEWRRLHAGEVLVVQIPVKGTGLPLARGRKLIAAPVQRVWPYIANCGKYSTTMVRVIRSRMLSQKDGVVECETVTKLPLLLGSLRTHSRAVHVAGPKVWSRVWTLVEGDFLYNTGAWYLTPLPGNLHLSLLTYEIHAEPNLSVPNFVIKRGQTSGVTNMLNRIASLATKNR